TFTSCVLTQAELVWIGRDLGQAVGCHELRPAPVEPAVVAFAVTVVARPGAAILIEVLVAQPHLVIEQGAPGHRASRGLCAPLPIIHVVLLKGAARAKHACSGK